MSASFDVVHKGRNIGNFHLPLQGAHNILNSLASIAAGIELNIEVDIMREALKKFSGVQRRFELKGEEKGVKIFDDYGHHPTEIKATLRAAKEGLMDSKGSQRLFVVFQPHRYTRMRDLMNEFSSCFPDADVLYLMDIYPAGEKPIDGINSGILVKSINKTGHLDVAFIPDREELIEKILSRIRKGDICFTLGAGDVWKIGDEILNKLRVRKEK
jgi:UDP-N-acetylmuramate--alanine ligase